MNDPYIAKLLESILDITLLLVVGQLRPKHLFRAARPSFLHLHGYDIGRVSSTLGAGLLEELALSGGDPVLLRVRPPLGFDVLLRLRDLLVDDVLSL